MCVCVGGGGGVWFVRVCVCMCVITGAHEQAIQIRGLYCLFKKGLKGAVEYTSRPHSDTSTPRFSNVCERETEREGERE